LLDRPFPDLSADRIDCTLRGLLRLKVITQREVITFVQSLVIHEGRIAVADLGSAVWFLRQYHQEAVGLFMDPVELAANASLAEAIEAALEVDVIEEADLMVSDEELLTRLRSCGIDDVTFPLQRLRPTLHVAVDDEAYDYHLMLKNCFVDPLVLTGGAAARCSDLDPGLAEFVSYYNQDRPHRSLGLETPVPSPYQLDGEVVSRPVLNGLHHVYERAA
jgi:hypothetical protein